jgi:hypothetical protein
MKNLTLLLKFKLAGDSRLHVKHATRIKIDGRGGLLLYDVRTGMAKTLDLSQLRSFIIQTLIVGQTSISVRHSLNPPALAEGLGSACRRPASAPLEA